MRRRILGAVLGAVVALAAGTVQAAPARWIATWAASPAPAMAAVGDSPRVRDFASPSLDNQTVVQVVRLSAGGARLRLRLTNEYGAQALKVGRARVALLAADGAVVPGSEREVQFSGAAGTVIPPKAPLLSDPVALKVPALASLRISLYFPEPTGLCGCHSAGAALAQISPKGDFTDKPFTPVATTQNRVFLSGVEVESSARGPVIVAFGDSITDGFLSTVGANRRWPDRLAERLAERGGGAVANAGIGGNRVLSNGGIPTFGESALSRLDRDVLAQPGATHIVMLEGVNDLGGVPSPTAEALIAGYRQVIARAHAHGIKVILGTIVPYKGARYYRAEADAVREAVNAWIRTGGEADGVVDFDAATRDPTDPARMRADFHAGDWLHPNDAGYRAMGDAVDLRLFGR